MISLTLLAIAPLNARAESPEERIAAAGALFGAKKYAEAAPKLDAFLVSYPTHSKAGVVAYTLGRCRSELKQYPLAVFAFEKAAASGTNSILIQAQLGLGEAALLSKQYAKAIAALEAATSSPLKTEQAPIVWYWLGQSNYQLQKYAKSETAFTKSFESYPEAEIADAACFGAALSAFKQKKTEVAKRDFKTLVEKYPKSQNALLAGLYVAQIDLADKRLPEAREVFASLLKFVATTPTNIRVQADAEKGLIQTLLALRDYGAASGRLEDALKRLVSPDPQYFRANLSLAHCQYHIKEFDLASKSYLEASKSPEPEVSKEAFYWAGASLLAEKKLSEAAGQFLKFVKKYPKDDLAPKAQLKAADSFYDLKLNEQAKIAYQTLIEAYPQSAEMREAQTALKEIRGEQVAGSLASARKEVAAKRYPEALLQLKSLLRSKPDETISAQANYLLGTVYEAQQKTEAAVSAYEEALNLKKEAPWNSSVQQNLAWLYLDLKRPIDAEKAAEKALIQNLKPENEIQVRLALTQAYLDQERWDPALESSKTLLEKKPDSETTATVLSLQASIYEKQAKLAEATLIYERLVSEFPKNEHAALALLRTGDDRSSENKFEEAEKRYSQLIADFPKSPLLREAHHSRASALYRLEKYVDAASEYDKTADDKNAENLIPDSLYWAGVSWDKGGKKETAIQRLAKLVEKYPADSHVEKAKIRLAALRAIK